MLAIALQFALWRAPRPASATYILSRKSSVSRRTSNSFLRLAAAAARAVSASACMEDPDDCSWKRGQSHIARSAAAASIRTLVSEALVLASVWAHAGQARCSKHCMS